MDNDKNCKFARCGKCAILISNSNCGETCSFRKTHRQAAQSQKATYTRLRSLPYAKQRYIAIKYYDSNMPWQKGGAKQ